MGKILYIRLDSSPLPEASNEIIVKDFSLESYFCTLFGKTLLEKVTQIQSVSFPGKMLVDFKDFSPETYRAIIVQWENILVKLLGSINGCNLRFNLNIPAIYFTWLSHHENSIYREIGEKQLLHLSFDGGFLYKELITSVLMKRLRFTFSKITDGIDTIVIALPSLNDVTDFVTYLKQLNKGFNDAKIISYQEFIDSYIMPKLFAKKRNELETQYELYPLREGRIRIRDKKTKKYGFINEQMDLVVPCKYDFCGYFVNGLAFAYNKKNESAYQIDKAGNIHELPSYDYYEVSDFSDGLARVKKKEGNYAYIDKEGKEVINYPRWCDDFKEGMAKVSDGDSLGFIDKTGKIVIPCKYENASDFSEGLARVEINDMDGFIDKTGKMVIPCKYEEASDFSEGLARVWFNDKNGFINKTGKIVIPYKYYIAHDFSEGLAAVCYEDDEKTYFIDKSGKIVFSISALSYKFSGGLAAIFNGSTIVGYINKTGKIVISKKFNENCSGNDYFNFSERLAIVRKGIDSLYGVIDKNGTTIVPFKYEAIYPFSEGIALVRGKHFNYGYINNKGEEIVPTVMSGSLRSFSDDMAWASVLVKGERRYILIKKEWIM